MHKLLLLNLIFVFLVCESKSQADTSKVEAQDSMRWNTKKYQKFNEVLILGLYTQYRNFGNEFVQISNRDTLGFSTHNFNAESRSITGIVVNFDKFNFSVGLRSQPQNNSNGKGFTKVFNFGFNIGDNFWVNETYFRRFTGFYNNNTPNFDTTFKKTGEYYVLPILRSTLFNNRFMAFTNAENFSYKAGFGCNYRQLKSAATWIYGGSVSYFSLINDSAIFPKKVQYLFNEYATMNKFTSFNTGAQGGAAITLVLFKAWFLSGYFTVGPEIQWRNYSFNPGNRAVTYLNWSGTARFSAGLNLKKCYLIFSFCSDYNTFNNSVFNYKVNSITGNLTYGWRFHRPTPEFYKKFKKTKLYARF